MASAYEDDRQIVELNVKKVYDVVEKTVIEIMKKPTLDDVFVEFVQILDKEDFFCLVMDLNVLASTLKIILDAKEEENIERIKNALLLVRQISHKYGKSIVEIAKKHKVILDTI